MTDRSLPDDEGVSRRNLMVGFGALAGAAAALVAVPGSPASAAGSMPAAGPLPEALDPIKPFLTYIGLDGLAFDTYAPGINAVEARYFDPLTGFGALQPNGSLAAALPLPAGSVIHQINVAYQGQPIVQVFRRQFTAPTPWQMPFVLSLDNVGGAQTQTVNLPTPISVEADSTYSIQFFLAPGATIYGVTIGYLPPTQAFIPFTGGPPRVLDTREAGGGGKLAASEERVIALGFPGARGAVINLTVTETEGAGFVAVNPANIAYPGNSSINWTTSGQNVANGVISAMDATAQIKIRGGANSTHVVIDRIGWLI